MMEHIVNNCPVDLWEAKNGGFPFWQQVYHSLESVDYWLRENYNSIYDDEAPKVWNPKKNVTAELNENIVASRDSLTKMELQHYLGCLYEKADTFFNNLNDNRLKMPIAEDNFEFTYLDIINMQVRHVMYHVGHCICILRTHTDIDVEWISHNER